MNPKVGDKIYVNSETWRKIHWIGTDTFEWDFGWSYLNQVELNPKYPKKSKIKWKLKL